MNTEVSENLNTFDKEDIFWMIHLTQMIHFTSHLKL